MGIIRSRQSPQRQQDTSERGRSEGTDIMKICEMSTESLK